MQRIGFFALLVVLVLDLVTEHAHRINLEIVERCNAEGIEFSLPCQLLHQAGESTSGRKESEKKRGLSNTLRR